MMAVQVSINVYEGFKVLRRNVLYIRVYFEISHGKSKSDSLGGVVKGYASREAAATNTVIRDAAELCQFCNAKLTVLGSDEHKKMLNRLFFLSSERKY